MERPPKRGILSIDQAEAHFLLRANSKFGAVPGIKIFTICPDRKELRRRGLHTALRAGISGCREGAYSIVMSGGYVDDADQGEIISYTGTGGTAGRDSSFGGDHVQKKDQTFDHKHNRALQASFERRTPVRVIRGHSLKSKYAPLAGYRYDGLYKVTEISMAEGKEGYNVCKFELQRLEGQPPLPTRED